ncbi:MAG TPA: GAF domain-containing sensor histidine kinase [Actinomycetota bacterium]|nr:GAF domain-containing sensor histidine kinase [Actinomycetota bacterium]
MIGDATPSWLGNLPKVLSDLGVAVVVWDDEIPIYVSPLFSQMIGYTPEELGVRRPAHLAGMAAAVPPPVARGGDLTLNGDHKGAGIEVPPFEFQLMHEFEWTLVHKGGQRVYVEAAAGTIEVAGRLASIGIFSDRSEQERAERQLKTRTLQQAAVADLGQQALAGAELPDLMDAAVNVITRVLEVEFARVLELAGDGKSFTVRAGVGWEEQSGSPGIDLRLTSQAAYTLVSDMPVVVEDFDSETRFAGPPWVKRSVASGMSVIVRGKGRPWGVLCTHTARHRRFSRDDVHFLQAIANVLAEAIVAKKVQDALRRAGDRERELREELDAHSRVVVAAQEAERRRIARELHDEIGQALTGLALSLASLEHRAPADLRAALGEARAGMGELVSRVHDFSLSLRPAMLDDLGLLPALLWLTEHVLSTQTGLHVALDHHGLDRRFSWEVETAAYRIVQEALNNVVRHAASGTAHVRCLFEDEEMYIEVRDSGIGFEPGAVRPHTTSGLRGMQERARLLGGQFRIESSPGRGTRVVASLPVQGGLLAAPDPAASASGARAAMEALETVGAIR